MILDTTVLIDLLRKDKATIEYIRQLQSREILKISMISVFELFRGAKDEASAAFLEKMVNDFVVLDISKKCAMLAGRIMHDLDSRGRSIDNEDAIIAATAFLHKDEVLTRNVKHFSMIPELLIKTY